MLIFIHPFLLFIHVCDNRYSSHVICQEQLKLFSGGQFLPRDAMLQRSAYYGPVSVCLFVCL